MSAPGRRSPILDDPRLPEINAAMAKTVIPELVKRFGYTYRQLRQYKLVHWPAYNALVRDETRELVRQNSVLQDAAIEATKIERRILTYHDMLVELESSLFTTKRGVEEGIKENNWALILQANRELRESIKTIGEYIEKDTEGSNWIDLRDRMIDKLRRVPGAIAALREAELNGTL